VRLSTIAIAIRPFMCVVACAAALASTCVTPAVASDIKPYDQRLMRLSEILGSIHYLRALCEADEGQVWRDKMQALLKAEGTSAARRARLAQKFNQGYQSYGRTYTTCTPTARVIIERFLSEGAGIAEELAGKKP
jgi:uncharacterized protein (TIGR02301 family)